MANTTLTPEAEIATAAFRSGGTRKLTSASAKLDKLEGGQMAVPQNSAVEPAGAIAPWASARSILFSAAIYGVLLIGGVWASLNLLRWFWRELL